MVRQRTIGANTEDKDAEEDEEDKNYKDTIAGNHKSIRQNKYVGMAEYLNDEDKVKSKGKNVVI